MAHADGRIYWYNERWYEYTGTTPAQMEGWGWQSVHDPRRCRKSWSAGEIPLPPGSCLTWSFRCAALITCFAHSSHE